MKQRTALKEIVATQYVADAVSFLASEKACYITGELSSTFFGTTCIKCAFQGQTLMIDSGMVLV